MAIRVICAGCMTSFEVDDRFAGKKGPCPKCGHIIEIPKEKLVIHAPDTVTDGKKTKPVGHDARPILQRRFIYTGKQVFWAIMGTLGVLAALFLVGAVGNPVLSAIVGIVAVFACAFPICEFGYTLIRDENDLEMFLGNEKHRRSFFASLAFAFSWLVFEAFVHFLGGQGAVVCLYMLAIGAVGAIGALIFFDCNYGKAFLVYLIFMFAAIIGRGLLLNPNGWIWESRTVAASTAPKIVPKAARMGGQRVRASDEEIVETKMAIKEAAAANRAKAKKRNKKNNDEAEADEQQEEEQQRTQPQIPQRPRVRRR